MSRYQDIPGSGKVRVTTTADVSRSKELVKREAMLQRVEPLEGTRMSLWNSQIPAFWQTTYGPMWLGTADLADRVWVANRCQHMNARQISRMPLQWHGPPVPDSVPYWMARTPDPNWYPNGIGDALYAVVHQLYGWGFSCQYITDWYSTGFPRTWTVLPSSAVQIKMEDGARVYKLGEQELDPDRVVQIDRDPQAGKVQGTSALAAYAQQAWGMLAAGNQSLAVSDGGVPRALLKPQQRTTQEQREDIAANWAAKMASRDPATPVVVPMELEYEQLSFSPTDMALLETQEWNARTIATAYGVPSVLLNMALQGGLTYQNPAALGEMWWRFELRPTATAVADALSERMLPAGQFVTFDAGDTFAPLTESSTADDPQKAQETQETDAPSQQPGLQVIGGGQP